MRRSIVTVFLVRGASQAPEPGPKLEVSASSDDALRDAAREALRERGLVVRALSFGPTGLVAYAEAAR
jgi:hypothetical protein